jgi:hypothetical protein
MIIFPIKYDFQKRQIKIGRVRHSIDLSDEGRLDKMDRNAIIHLQLYHYRCSQRSQSSAPPAL